MENKFSSFLLVLSLNVHVHTVTYSLIVFPFFGPLLCLCVCAHTCYFKAQEIELV
jgi:hypothetical protein